MLGRRIDRVVGTDLMAGHGGDVDEMPGFLLLYGSAAALPYSTPLRLTSIVRSHSSTLRRSSGARHQPGIVDHDVDTPERLPGGVDQSLHLVAVGDVCRYGECLAAPAGQLVR